MDGLSSSSPSSAPVIVIATSSLPHLIDAALLRPGRLGRHLALPLPGPAAREDILRAVTRHMPVCAPDVPGVEDPRAMTPPSPALRQAGGAPVRGLGQVQGDVGDELQVELQGELQGLQEVQSGARGKGMARLLAALARHTAGMSGADLRSLCTEAAMAALRDAVRGHGAAAGAAGAAGAGDNSSAGGGVAGAPRAQGQGLGQGLGLGLGLLGENELELELGYWHFWRALAALRVATPRSHF